MKTSQFANYICPNCEHAAYARKRGVKNARCPFCGNPFPIEGLQPVIFPPAMLPDMDKSEWQKSRPHKGKRLDPPCDSFTVVDIETTGRGSFDSAILEITGLKIVNGCHQNTFSTLINPHFPIPWAIENLTGITDSDVAGAPDIAPALRSFLDFLGDDVIIGHNCAAFDVNFIYDYTEYTLGIPLTNDFIDTLYLSRSIFPELPSHKLKDLIEALGIRSKPTHRAEDDCWATLELYNILSQKFIEKGLDKKKKKKASSKGAAKGTAQTPPSPVPFPETPVQPQNPQPGVIPAAPQEEPTAPVDDTKKCEICGAVLNGNSVYPYCDSCMNPEPRLTGIPAIPRIRERGTARNTEGPLWK